MYLLKNVKWRSLGILSLAYILWAFCYPPFLFSPLVFAVLAPMFRITAGLSKREAFFYHFAASVMYNGIMYYWIFNVMAVGPPVVIGLGVSLLILYFSLLSGYLGWLFKYVQHSSWGWLGYAALWTGFEVARTKGQMSFPWGNIGYALGGQLSLIQASSAIGVFGLSFVVVACNYWLYQGVFCGRKRALAAVPLVCVSLWVFGIFRLGEKDGLDQARTADISLVQPSVEQTRKWDEKYFNKVMETTFGVMDSRDLSGSDLIVLAETAVPAFLHRRPGVTNELRERAAGHGSDIIVGSLDFTSNSHPAKPFRFYNCAFLLPRDTAEAIRKYAKLKLVPFSERIPFDNIFPILNYVDLGEGDFSTGTEIMVWGREFTYSPTICYEVVYPAFMRKIKDKGVDLLVNITNDGWFGNSPAPYQHANICKFRAVETGMPVARCANNGISLFYDCRGRTLAQTRLFEKTVLRGTVPLATLDTVYQAAGTFIEEFFFWVWVLGNVLIAGFEIGRRKNRAGA